MINFIKYPTLELIETSHKIGEIIDKDGLDVLLSRNSFHLIRLTKLICECIHREELRSDNEDQITIVNFLGLFSIRVIDPADPPQGNYEENIYELMTDLYSRRHKMRFSDLEPKKNIPRVKISSDQFIEIDFS